MGTGANQDVLILDANLPAVGLVKAINDGHQRALAGAIFPDNAMDGAGLDGQVNVLVGLDGAKGFADTDQFKCGHRVTHKKCVNPQRS